MFENLFSPIKIKGLELCFLKWELNLQIKTEQYQNSLSISMWLV